MTKSSVLTSYRVKLPKSFLAVNLSESHTFHKKDDTEETTISEMKSKGELTARSNDDGSPRRGSSLDLDAKTVPVPTSGELSLQEYQATHSRGLAESGGAVSIPADANLATREISRTEEPKREKNVEPGHPREEEVPAQLLAPSALHE